MIDMRKNIDVYVCNPDIGITENLAFVFIAFEQMDTATLEGTGKSHGVSMPTADAMQLLRNLQFLQKQHGLEPAPDDPTEVIVSPKGTN
jgi:hypothetical protein